MNSDEYSIFIRRELVREERCRDEKQTFGDVRTSARLHGARVVEIILALSREHISWWFIKRREPVYREPSTKEGEEGSQGVGWRTECGLTGRPSPAFSSIMDQERKKERERNERREKRGREENWPNRLWILMGSIGVLEYSFTISNIFHEKSVIHRTWNALFPNVYHKIPAVTPNC